MPASRCGRDARTRGQKANRRTLVNFIMTVFSLYKICINITITLYISLHFIINIFCFVVKCQIQQELRTRESVFFFIAFQYYGSNLPLLRKSNAFFWCWMTETDVGVNSRALSHLFCSFLFPELYGSPRALREGKIQEEKRERAWERACVTKRERKREKDSRGEHSDATRSHAPGSNLPIALSGIRKALQSWVELGV